MSKVKEYLKNTVKTVKKPTLTKSQVATTILEKPTYLNNEQVKTDHLHYQTLMIVGINLAINKAKHIFNLTTYADRSIVSNISTTLTKLKKSFMSKLKQGYGDYENYLENATVFIERLCTLGFGIKTENRTSMLLYTSKIASWLNAQSTNTKNNFLWITYGEKEVTEFNVYGEILEVSHVAEPIHGERVLIHTHSNMKGYLISPNKTNEEVIIDSSGVLAYYDSQDKLFILDDGVIIKGNSMIKWISYDELTKTL